MTRLILFLLINFGALGIGGLMLGNPATNQWYQSLHKAPWTPPGWFFGLAWTTIMICFSIFLWHFSQLYPDKQLFYMVFALQFILNVGWNPTFFRWHFVAAGLLIILALTVVVAVFTFWGFRYAGMWGLLMLPYLLWLCIASSLNWYVLAKN